MTKFFKGKSNKQIKTAEPRSLDAIQAEYNLLCAQAGAAQYQKYVHGRELERLNAELVRVNQEAAQRQALDAAKEKQENESSSANLTNKKEA